MTNAVVANPFLQFPGGAKWSIGFLGIFHVQLNPSLVPGGHGIGVIAVHIQGHGRGPVGDRHDHG